MPVYAKQYGRLGNQLFQKAAAIGYAIKHGHDYITCPWHTNNTLRTGNPLTLKEGGHNFQELPYEHKWAQRAIVLDGYWQSARYFNHCREEVLNAFAFHWELKKGWCSIHIRRGDYLKYPDKHPVVTMDYLRAAMANMSLHFGIDRFMVFSDDLIWCIEQFSGLPYEFLYSTDHTEVEDLELMSSCQHHIISNSTFSWWGAWLNQNPDKVVISPSKDNWFGPGNKHLDTSDLIPESWIQIKY